jgi:hypothetical protein
MNFRWLKFWGDLRQGLHPSWLVELFPNDVQTIGRWVQHEVASAKNLRHLLLVENCWDEDLAPEKFGWAMLNNTEFSRWCEALGLITLGPHLNRLISLRSVERLKISLGRQTIAALLDFSNRDKPYSSRPLPLDLPSAERLGQIALMLTCSSAYPQFWSRLRLRFDKSHTTIDPMFTNFLVFTPTAETLKDLDALLFDGPPKSNNQSTVQRDETWMQVRTLSA